MKKDKKEEAIKNKDIMEEIAKLKRMVELMGRDSYKIVIRRALSALLLCFFAIIVCLVVFGFTIQNFITWKQEIEELTIAQNAISKEVTKTIKDMSWIHMQRLMIEDLLNLGEKQIKDFKQMEEYRTWEKQQMKRLERSNENIK